MALSGHVGPRLTGRSSEMSHEEAYVTDTDRRAPVATCAATFVIGLEAVQGSLTIGDYQVAVQRLERAIRPWDRIVDIAPRTVGVLCTALSGPRELDAIA